MLFLLCYFPCWLLFKRTKMYLYLNLLLLIKYTYDIVYLTINPINLLTSKRVGWVLRESGIPVFQILSRHHLPFHPSFSRLCLVPSISMQQSVSFNVLCANSKRFFICFYTHLLPSRKFDVAWLVCVFFPIYHNFNLAFVWVGVTW